MAEVRVEALPIDDLAARCRAEANRPMQQRDTRFCLELFRRAIVEGDAVAWAAVYAQYHALVRYWLGNAANADDLTQEAFARFGRTVTAERLSSGSFPDLARLLAYLRCIAISLRINEARRAERERRALDAWARATDPQTGGDCLDEARREELVEYIHSLITDEREWLVVRLTFEYDLPPREIAHRYPQLFAGAAEVSRIKERVTKRLRSNPRLRTYLER